MRSIPILVAAFVLLAGCTAADPAPRAPLPAAPAAPAGSPATGAALVPADLGMCLVDPGRPATLRWSGGPAAAAFVVRDFAGRQVDAGEARAAGGALELTRSFARGYHEVAFPALGQTFGVVAIEARDAAPDPFFAIDAALSWLDTDPARRAALVRALPRLGVAMARERLGLGGVHPRAGAWAWDPAPRRFGSLRAGYAAAGVPLLEMLQGSAQHLPRAPGLPYPQELAPLAAAWTAVARHWGAGWGAAEADNEPDLAGAPADQYVAQTKAMSRALAEAGGAVPLVGGVFGYQPPGPFFDACLANGLLADCDALSFHCYERAPAVEGLVAGWRAWLAAGGAASMPLWLSECGWPWASGPEHPPRDQDVLSAMEIAAQAAESRACGVARHFPFVLPFYVEGPKNFGMLGREGTPLRSLAAYAQCIAALSGRRYVGDLVGGDARIRLARVFAGAPGAPWVALLYTGEPAAGAALRAGAPVLRAEGADGRALAVQDGAVPLDDGLAYAWLDPVAAAPALRRDTGAARLLALAERGWTRPRLASPLVLQFQAQDLGARPSARRYLVDEAVARALPIQVRVHNLSDAPATAALTLALPGGASHRADPVAVPPRGCAEVRWRIDATAALDIAATRLLTVSASAEGAPAPSPLAIPLMMEGGFDAHLARHPRRRALPIAELARWTPNHTGHASSTMAAVGAGWRVDNRFATSHDRWDYPVFTLDRPIDPARESGFLIRARIARPAGRVAIMANPNRQDSFWCSDLFPADGAWHVAYVPFAELKPGPNGLGMQNTRLDPASWRTIALGMGSQAEDNRLEVSDLLVVGGAE